jgi:hypothetical protein
MKRELFTAFIGATVAANVTAQEDDVQIALGRNLLSRLDRGGRSKKVTELEQFKEEIKFSESSWNSPTESDNNWISSNSKWKSPNSWSSSSSKSSKSSTDYKDGMFLVPFICPRKCVDGIYTPGNIKLENAVQNCNVNNDKQQWNIYYNDQFMKLENHAFYEKGWCIGVDKSDTCSTSKSTLSFVHCDDPGSDWYFTGGQLLSGYCWIRGVSVAMSANCTGLLTISGLMDSSTMFMFVGKDYIDSIEPTTNPTTKPTNNPTNNPTQKPA